MGDAHTQRDKINRRVAGAGTAPQPGVTPPLSSRYRPVRLGGGVFRVTGALPGGAARITL